MSRAEAKAAFAPSKAAEMGYVRDMRGILRTLHVEAEGYLGRVLGGRRSDAAFWEDDFNALVERIISESRARTEKAFDRMESRARKKGYRAAAKLLGVRNPDIGLAAVAAAARERNIRLVEEAGRSYAAQVREVLADPGNMHRRWEEIAAEIKARGGVSDSRAELIARDQTLKVNGAIASARQRSAGVTRYTWSTSLDERVRERHRELAGTEQLWSVPPIVDPRDGRREHPGGDYQCRCVAIPVIPGLEGIDLEAEGG